MQNRFTTELLKSLSSMQDRKKSALITKEEYELHISSIIDAKQANSKTNHQHYFLRKFDVLVCGAVQKVIKKQNLTNDIPIQWYLSCTTIRRSDKCGRKRQVVVDHRFAIAECFLSIH